MHNINLRLKNVNEKYEKGRDEIKAHAFDTLPEE